MMNHAAKIWEETVLLPTYPAAEPEKYPLFIEKRAYQGSTGKVYPLPVTEKVSDVCREVAYHAVWLENEYLRVMVLPELGGRIHRALDKTNGYDFVYYNHVVKPALVGLTGPWISGGIEFNWPQHHRPTTFSPVDYRVAEHDDGSVTVYVGETDKMYGTKGMAAISLYPGKAYLEIRGRLYNPTDLPQTFLWWANPAVPVNDHTYSVFPPDVNAVMDGFLDFLEANHPDLPARIEQTQALTDEDEALIREYLGAYKGNISRLSDEVKAAQALARATANADNENKNERGGNS